MDEFFKEAVAIAKAQATVRPMTEEEITSLVKTLAENIRKLEPGEECAAVPEETPVEPKASIREKSITCLVCGKTFKVLTNKHLLTHGLNQEEYREKYGFKPKTPLVCKALRRERKSRMKDMKLWEKRSKPKAGSGQQEA